MEENWLQLLETEMISNQEEYGAEAEKQLFQRIIEGILKLYRLPTVGDIMILGQFLHRTWIIEVYLKKLDSLHQQFFRRVAAIEVDLSRLVR